MINETVISAEIEDILINFNGPEDDSDGDFDEDFDLDIETMGNLEDFDDIDDL